MLRGWHPAAGESPVRALRVLGPARLRSSPRGRRRRRLDDVLQQVGRARPTGVSGWGGAGRRRGFGVSFAQFGSCKVLRVRPPAPPSRIVPNFPFEAQLSSSSLKKKKKAKKETKKSTKPQTSSSSFSRPFDKRRCFTFFCVCAHVCVCVCVCLLPPLSLMGPWSLFYTKATQVDVFLNGLILSPCLMICRVIY